MSFFAIFEKTSTRFLRAVSRSDLINRINSAGRLAILETVSVSRSRFKLITAFSGVVMLAYIVIRPFKIKQIV